MSENSTKKPFFLWSCILHASILLILILDISLTGSSAPASSPSQNIIHATVINAKALAQMQATQQQAAQKIQQILKAQQVEEQKVMEQKVAAQKAATALIVKQQAAELAAQKAAVEKAAEKAAAAKAVAMKQSIEKQLKASMEKQLANTKPNTKPNTTKSNSTKPSPVSGAKSNPGLMDKYIAMIIQAISEQWIVPQNLPNNISCILNVRVAPGGVVLQVSVEKSSGNPILDNSAMAAVNKASPLPVPTDPNLFEAFRTLKLTVKPDGSMLEN